MDRIIVSEIVSKVTFYFCIFIGILTLGAYITSVFLKNDAILSFKNRMKSLWVLIFLFVGSLSFSKVVAFVFFGLLSAVALWEYLKLVQRQDETFLKNCYVYLFIPIQYLILYKYSVLAFYLFIPLFVLFLLPVIKIILGNDEDFMKHTMLLHCGLMLIVYSMGYLGAFLLIQPQANFDGLALILFILVITLMNDFMQAVFGQVFGRHKIVPSVSPNKTVEGLLGGVFITVLLSLWIGHYLTPLNNIQLVILGIILSVFGFFGDVTMSAIKRDVGVKDTSNILPGHGGVLDRFDSLFYTAPLFFHYIAFLYTVNFLH